MSAHIPSFAVTPDELRLLDQHETDLIKVASRPDLEQLSQAELVEVVQRLRDRRDRARELANRQRRELRGKADPAGATAATQNAGTEGKARILALALDRVTQERQRRAAAGDAVAPSPRDMTQRDLSERAMALKTQGDTAPPMTQDGGPLHPDDQDADPGKGRLAEHQRKAAPSGALDHAGELPSRERSRTRY